MNFAPRSRRTFPCRPVFNSVPITRGRKRATPQCRTTSPHRPAMSSSTMPRCRDGSGPLVWAANVFLVMVFPVFYTIGMVVPLLSDTIPFLVSWLPPCLQGATIMQATFLVLVAMLARDFYSVMLPCWCMPVGEKWRQEWSKAMAGDASHCSICNECTRGRLFHSVALGVCVHQGTIASYRRVMRRLTTTCTVGMILLLMQSALGRPPQTAQIIIFLCSIVATGHLAAWRVCQPANSP